MIKKIFKYEIKSMQYLLRAKINISKILYSIRPFSQSSSEWLNRHNKDQYVKKAKIQDYRSRASFKIIEINNKFKILRPGQRVLDIGSSPGGWSQIISNEIKSSINNPSVIAVDINYMEELKGVSFVQGDMNDKETHDKILEANSFGKFDLVCSDMCPEFTGSKLTDHYNLINLNIITKEFAFKVLKNNGHFVMKTFEGSMQKKLQTEITKYFNKIHRFKPASSRQESSELYLICLGYLNNEELKREAEELMKMEPSEFLEKKKEEYLKNYMICKFDPEFDLRELDKMKEEIIKKFKIDPDTVKITDEYEEEVKGLIEKQKEEFHKEYFGRAYSTKARNLSEIYQEYVKDMKENEEKLKIAMQKEKIDIKDFEEFFKVDEDEKYLKEVSETLLKEAEFTEKQMKILEDKINDEEAKEILNFKDEEVENKILSKYKKWSELLDNERRQHVKKFSDSLYDYNENIKEDLSFKEGIEDNIIQNKKKTIKKQERKKSTSDIFWNKRNNPNNN